MTLLKFVLKKTYFSVQKNLKETKDSSGESKKTFL